VDGDPIIWSLAEQPEHLSVSIDPETGRVTLVPEADWFGNETVTFIASDGEFQASQTITVQVVPVNDIPWIATVDGAHPATDPLHYTVSQGETLTITYTVRDIEGDELHASLNISTVILDEAEGTITFIPGDDEVGVLRFALQVWDLVSPSEKVTINFVIEVVIENDPMDDPVIKQPPPDSRFKVNQTFSLKAQCFDPDTRFGQKLNYSWSSNLSGHLGFGESLIVRLRDIGTHVITVTVTDGEFEKIRTVSIIIEPEDVIEPPPPDGNGGEVEDGPNYVLIMVIIAVMTIIGAVLYVSRTRQKTEELEAEDEEEYKREHMERALTAIKEAADVLEADKEAKEWEEESREDVEVEVESLSVPEIGLSMEVARTKAADAETMALFDAAEASEPAMSEEEQEQLRLDNEKRKFQNAIGRLPYGIPSHELEDWDWVHLVAALATGDKRMTPDGRETTNIDGRWYYSDVKDTGSFLKEHGAKPEKAEPKKTEMTTDKAALLAKLEERFILGEISEETYNKLAEKYSEEE
jgi:uncharacterized membrane protein